LRSGLGSYGYSREGDMGSAGMTEDYWGGSDFGDMFGPRNSNGYTGIGSHGSGTYRPSNLMPGNYYAGNYGSGDYRSGSYRGPTRKIVDLGDGYDRGYDNHGPYATYAPSRRPTSVETWRGDTGRRYNGFDNYDGYGDYRMPTYGNSGRYAGGDDVDHTYGNSGRYAGGDDMDHGYGYDMGSRRPTRTHSYRPRQSRQSRYYDDANSTDQNMTSGNLTDRNMTDGNGTDSNSTSNPDFDAYIKAHFIAASKKYVRNSVKLPAFNDYVRRGNFTQEGENRTGNMTSNVTSGYGDDDAEMHDASMDAVFEAIYRRVSQKFSKRNDTNSTPIP